MTALCRSLGIALRDCAVWAGMNPKAIGITAAGVLATGLILENLGAGDSDFDKTAKLVGRALLTIGSITEVLLFCAVLGVRREDPVPLEEELLPPGDIP